jgi:hypothetical protein
MDCVEVTVFCPVKGATFLGLRDSHKRAKRRGEFPTVNPFTTSAHLEEVFIVTELTATHYVMELLG